MSSIIKRGKYAYKMKQKSKLQDELGLVIKEAEINCSKFLLVFQSWQIIHDLSLVLDGKQQDIVEYLEELILKDLKSEIDPD